MTLTQLYFAMLNCDDCIIIIRSTKSIMNKLRLTQLNFAMCSSRKHSYCPHRRDWNFLGVGDHH